MGVGVGMDRGGMSGRVDRGGRSIRGRGGGRRGRVSGLLERDVQKGAVETSATFLHAIKITTSGGGKGL